MSERQVHIHTERERTKALQDAIGYLSMWAIDSYNVLNIYDDNAFGSKHNLTAYYQNSETGGKYVIGAIYDEKDEEYSFHS